MGYHKSRLSRAKGSYGKRKYRAFTILQQLGDKYGRSGWLSIREWCILSGVPYRSLTRAIPDWLAWQYVERRPATVQGRGDYEYRLLEHGKSWLELAREKLHTRKRLHQDLILYLNKFAVPNFDRLLNVGFDLMNTTIDTVLKQVDLRKPRKIEVYKDAHGVTIDQIGRDTKFIVTESSTTPVYR